MIIVYSILHSFSFFAYVTLAIYVLHKSTKAVFNRVLTALIGCFAIWSLANTVIYHPSLSDEAMALFMNVAAVGWISFSSLTIWFYLLLIGKTNVLRSKIFYLLNFTPPIVFLYMQLRYNSIMAGLLMKPFGPSNLWANSVWAYLFFFYLYLSIGFALGTIFTALKKSNEPLKKKYFQIMFVTSTPTVILGLVTDVILPCMNIHLIPNLGNVYALLWAGGIVYAVVRYRFLSITPAAAAREILSTMLEALVLLDRNLKIMDINDTVVNLLGYHKNDLQGKPLTFLFPEENISTLGPQVEKLIKEESLKNFETCWKAKSGEEIPFFLNSSALRNHDGNLIGTVCTATDLTLRKKAENALKLHNVQLGNVAEICKEISLSLNINDVLGWVLEQTAHLLKADRISILLRDENDNLTIKASRGIAPEVAEKTVIKMGEKISGRVAARQEVLFVKDLDQDKRFDPMDHEIYHTKSFISCPLIVKGATIGVLNVNNKTDRTEFNEFELEMLKTLCANIATTIENARLYSKLRESYINTVESLAVAIDARDTYTEGHCQRVCKTAVRIGKQMKLDREKLENLNVAALLHDIGKIGISDNILLKPGMLTEEEWKKMKEHPEFSEKIIQPLGFPTEVLKMVRHHHERFDGTGYPDKMSGDDTLLETYILGIVDAYDAMTSNRPYRRRLAKKKALEELRKGRGTQFHPHVVDVFLAMLEKK